MGGGRNQKPKCKRVPFVKPVEPFSLPTISFINSSGILVLTFENTNSLSKCLQRAHDCYEGGKLRGALKGINMPYDVLYNWTYSIGLHRLKAEELKLWIKIEKLDVKYVIACIKGDSGTMLHEYAHAIYHLDDSYRKLVGQLWENISKLCIIAICKELKIRNYKEEMWVDEWQAYTVESCREFGKKWGEELLESHQILRKRLGKPAVVEECSTNLSIAS
jgi:hypothetical protein